MNYNWKHAFITCLRNRTNLESARFVIPNLFLNIYADSDTGLQLHLDNQNYQVCIMPQPGLCSIRWTPTTESTFVMTGAFIGSGAAIGMYYQQGWALSIFQYFLDTIK